MKVQKIVSDRGARYLFLDDQFQVVDEVYRYLSFLEAAGKSPNTLRSYAYHLKLFYSVAKRTGASKTYLYNNEAIASSICEYRERSESKQSPESQSVLIKALKRKIQQLEAEIQKMRKENSDSYKSQCERLKKENQELKVQLQTAYSLYSDKKE